MEENEMLEQTNETENVETRSTEEMVDESIGDLTDSVEEVKEPDILPVRKIEMTQEEFDEKIKLRLLRQERKYQKELSKQSSLIEKLKVGMGKDSIDDLDNDLTKYYEEQGIKMPKSSYYNERDEMILAKAEVEEIIASGTEEMEREADELAKIPQDKRSIREKTILSELVSKLMYEKGKEELTQKGADVSVLDKKEFKDFQSKFSATTPLSEVYDVYEKINKATTPIETPKPIGSVKSNVVNNEIKEYYTPEEISKFTKEDYLRNPKLMEAVENSLAKK